MYTRFPAYFDIDSRYVRRHLLATLYANSDDNVLKAYSITFPHTDHYENYRLIKMALAKHLTDSSLRGQITSAVASNIVKEAFLEAYNLGKQHDAVLEHWVSIALTKEPIRLPMSWEDERELLERPHALISVVFLTQHLASRNALIAERIGRSEDRVQEEIAKVTTPNIGSAKNLMDALQQGGWEMSE